MKKILYRNNCKSQQKGVVLAMGLILLAVISLVAMYTLRGTITGEQVSKNLRTNAVAMQSAETALRLCEDAVRTSQTLLGTEDFIKNDAPETLAGGEMPSQWQTRLNWLASAGKTIQIPADRSIATGMRPLPRPRCMVEQYELPIMGEDKTVTQPYLITVVGYSSDYQADTNGNAIAGSEVWLQSVLRP